MAKITERIEREIGVHDLVGKLAETLSPTDLQSLMLEVYRKASARRDPALVLADYERSRFVQPARLDPRCLAEWEGVALAELPGEFERINLSPVCPLGSSSTVSSVSQDWTISTSRNTEVVSDPTNVMALECALRRRKILRSNPKSMQPIHLATSHRVVRSQFFEDPKLLTHFSVIALCSAGRDWGNMRFETSAILLHSSFYISAIRAYLGSDVRLRLSVSNFDDIGNDSSLADKILEPIQASFANVESRFDPERTSGRGYYESLCFKIHAFSSAGGQIELVDGGIVPWVAKLLSNAKERLAISGVGSERVCTEFDR